MYLLENNVDQSKVLRTTTPNESVLNVTKSYLPNKKKYQAYIDRIFDSHSLTNRGPLSQELELRLAEYLGVKHLLLVSNGTMALHVAYRLLGLRGEVITSPFSFAATSSSLVWEKLKPIYTDICSKSFNLNPRNIVSSITERTSAIVPVHVFGNACAVDDISQIAKEHGLKVIYDAAHAFNVRGTSKSLFEYGDISTLSLHATKMFHTVEGGALVFNDADLYEQAKALINFGIDSTGTIAPLGINAKMSEFHAAMGLCVLDDIDIITEQRKKLVTQYRINFGGRLQLQLRNSDFTDNYAYLPVVFPNVVIRQAVESALGAESINPRRYFSPSLNEVYAPYQSMPNSQSLSERVLCLPLYPGLSKIDVLRVTNIIHRTLDRF
ncbi:DegT/DnrJ/EryC1/StrS aminotransferase family protein [Agarivorans sp. 1_MG-2023]|uniref:DegT/DnrJ/EryC1/StrS family aminotransferase n=1 Tax=Agarivorans sp. 1_MG-2023 TaxID=3062634 RepID=UPI0026E3501E|nr:DegT/DnrJ/EryC1/StrS family aminotransferase [Agarivorans sp. 1_MG-2023]MDO6763953.1 DegT/DnrJ/EryC1/StrS family aminotransferase [Agarivorans sp. 1_MG-2023]